MLSSNKKNTLATELQTLKHLLCHGENLWHQLNESEFDVERICQREINPLLDAMEESVKKIAACFQPNASKRKLPLDHNSFCKKCKPASVSPETS